MDQTTPPAVTSTDLPGKKQEEFRRIMDIFIHAATTSCSCASNLKVIEFNTDTEVSWDDLAHRCTDFGISDYLSISPDSSHSYPTVEVQSDEDYYDDIDGSYMTYWLSTTPPQRLSDTDLATIEPTPVTLDTLLIPSCDNGGVNPEPNVFEDDKPVNVEQVHFFQILQGGMLLNHDGMDPKIGSNFFGPASVPVTDNVPVKKDDESRSSKARTLSRQVSLPPKLFAEFASNTSCEEIPVINYSLNKQESMSESSTTLFTLKDRKLIEFIRVEREFIGVPKLKSRRLSSSSISLESSFPVIDTEDDFLLQRRDNSDCGLSGGVFDETYDSEIQYDDPPPFTSDIEKLAILVRLMRKRLLRQDTVGNIAPPHFCI